MSYVERQGDTDLFSALLDGDYCYVFASRQMGKSSLAVRTRARLQAVGVNTVFLDLTRIGGSNVTPEQWYLGLLLAGDLDTVHKDEQQAAVLDLYRKVLGRRVKVADYEMNPLVAALQLSGITASKQGNLCVRNRIYERVFDAAWIVQSMSNAEMRRQKVAFRRGLQRAAVYFGCMLIVVSCLTAEAIRQGNLAAETAAQARAEGGRRQELLYAADMSLAYQSYQNGHVGRALELLDAHRPGKGESDPRGFEWFYIWRLCRGSWDREFSGHPGVVGSVAISPNGRWIASCAEDGEGVLHGCKNEVWSLAVSADGQELVTGDKVWHAAAPAATEDYQLEDTHMASLSVR